MLASNIMRQLTSRKTGQQIVRGCYARFGKVHAGFDSQYLSLWSRIAKRQGDGSIWDAFAPGCWMLAVGTIILTLIYDPGR